MKPTRKIAKKYPTNWELSSARAAAVVKYLIDKGYESDLVWEKIKVFYIR